MHIFHLCWEQKTINVPKISENYSGDTFSTPIWSIMVCFVEASQVVIQVMQIGIMYFVSDYFVHFEAVQQNKKEVSLLDKCGFW